MGCVSKNLLSFCLLCMYLSHYRETHGSGSAYHKELAKQLAVFLDKPLQVS